MKTKPWRQKIKTILQGEKALLPTFFRDIRQISTLYNVEIEEICRSACQSVYIGNNVILCRVLTKYLMFADASDIGIMPHLSLNGFWETWITKRFVQTVQPGWNCIDVGANHGYFSLLMADLIGQTGKILAVEPNPKLARLLSQNLEVNGYLGFASVVQKAVSAQSGEMVDLVIPADRALNAAINLPKTDSDAFFLVETATLDELTEDWDRVDFVKIDAEGAEEIIWSGMSAMIKKNPQIIVIMEFKNSRYKNPKGFLQRILDDNFVLRHIDYDSEIKDLTLNQTLTQRFEEDWMLFLRQN